jgi:hypothetical protein
MNGRSNGCEQMENKYKYGLELNWYGLAVDK